MANQRAIISQTLEAASGRTGPASVWRALEIRCWTDRFNARRRPGLFGIFGMHAAIWSDGCKGVAMELFGLRHATAKYSCSACDLECFTLALRSLLLLSHH